MRYRWVKAARSQSTASRSRYSGCETARYGPWTAVCPHMGGPLADGLADDTVVVCPLHGHTFDLSTGCEAGGHELSVRSYPVEVVDGTVRVSFRRA